MQKPKSDVRRACFAPFLLAIYLVNLPQPAISAEPNRAAPPSFSPEEAAIFPENGFTDLTGPRPERLSDEQLTQAADKAANGTAGSPGAGGQGGGNWSSWVDEETLETEIKRQSRSLTAAVTSPARFKSGGFRTANDAQGIVSLLMAVTSAHDGTPRWQDTAQPFIEHFATGEDELEANDSSHQLATNHAEELAELIRGGRPSIRKKNGEADWSRYASRETIMRRMEASEVDRLAVWVIDRREMRRNSEDVRHEAQLLALLAEAMMQPGAYDGDDEDYQAYCRQLRDAAVELALAAEEVDQPAAQSAYNKAKQSCVDCHADYRG